MVRSADEQREKGDRAIALTDRAYSVLGELEESTTAQVQATLEASYKQLEKQLLKQYSQYTASAKPDLLPSQRTLLLLTDLQELLPIVNPKNAATYQKQFQELGEKASKIGVDLGKQIIETQEGKSLSKARQSGGVPIEAIAFAARDSAKRLQKHGQTFADKSSAIIQLGLTQNWAGQKTAQLMRQELGVTKSRADTIVRTESASAMVAGQQHSYKAAGFGEFFQFMTAGGSCGICGARNMNVYESTASRPPLHPRCRCTTLPWSKDWQELGLTNDAWAVEYVDNTAATLSTPLDPGLSPFEKANGLTTPPTPTWTVRSPSPAGGIPQQPAPTPKADKAQAAPKRAKLPPPEVDVTATIQLGQKRLIELAKKYGSSRPDAIIQALLAESRLSPEQAAQFAGHMQLEDSALEVGDADFYRKTLADYHRITNGSVRWVRRFAKLSDRAFARIKDQVVNVGDKPTERIIFHEMSHFLEKEYPEIGETMRQWRDRRAQGDLKKLRDITGDSRYRDNETALPDTWTSPYIGKVYQDGATEALSVGMEAFASREQMMKVFKADPEHLYLIVGVLEKLKNQEYKRVGELRKLAEQQGAGGEDVLDFDVTDSRQSGRRLTPVEAAMQRSGGYRQLTPVEAAMQRRQQQAGDRSARNEFEEYLSREEASIRRRTSGEIDRQLKEYHDKEAAELRKKLNIPDPPEAVKRGEELTITQQRLKTPETKPIELDGVDTTTLTKKGTRAYEIAQEFSSIQRELNDAIARIPPASKTLPPDAYDAIYARVDSLFTRLKGGVTEINKLWEKVPIKTGDPTLDAYIAKIGSISREALPGYKVILPTEKLEERASLRPC